VAAGILRVGKEDGETNLADLLMKVLMGKKCWGICWYIPASIGRICQIWHNLKPLLFFQGNMAQLYDED
jgi:hypothetical protein